MINTSNQLTTQQLKDLNTLTEECKKKDGSTPNLYLYLLEQPRTLPASVFYYENQKMLGFLSVYFFYDEAVEIALLIHPDFRRKGIAKQLLITMKPLLDIYNIKKLIFTTPTQQNKAWLSALGFSYQHSEYHMIRHDFSPLFQFTQNVTFREAQTEDIPTLCFLDEACFPKKQTELPERFQSVLNDRNYQIIVILHNNQLLGKAHIRWGAQNATFSDIAILPEHQGKGLGTALIAHCINTALKKDKLHISLDVETHNTKALNLYTRLGFIIQNACDYWHISMEKLGALDPLQA